MRGANLFCATLKMLDLNEQREGTFLSCSLKTKNQHSPPPPPTRDMFIEFFIIVMRDSVEISYDSLGCERLFFHDSIFSTSFMVTITYLLILQSIPNLGIQMNKNNLHSNKGPLSTRHLGL